jgi:hypothetical protein
MDSCLNEYNKHCVRKDGLDLLLTFMEVLGEQMEEQVTTLVVCFFSFLSLSFLFVLRRGLMPNV